MFGSNFYSSCLIDLSELIQSETTDFFDPFIEDVVIGGVPVLRPIPVFLKNYRGTSGDAVNRGDVASAYRAVRRFFFMDNYTSDSIVQYLTNLSIRFEMSSDGANRIRPPVLELEYTQYQRNDIARDPSIVRLTKETLTHVPFHFQVLYTSDNSGFWSAVQTLFIVVVALSVFYVIFNIFLYLRTDGQDGFSCSVMLGSIALFFDIVASALFLIAFFFGIYVLFAFKSGSRFYLPPEEELEELLLPVLWICFGFKLFSCLLFVAIQAGMNVFIVDWEDPDVDDMANANWRRLLVANQWNRVLTTRHYNVPFSLLAFVFFFEGLRWDLASAPIPTFSLIDTGTESLILKVAIMSAVWFVLIAIECLVTVFLIWRVFGDPFESLVDLCVTSNLSLFMQSSLFHGYYINGKSNAEIDVLGKEATRIDGAHRVFETFLSLEARHGFNDLYNSLLAQTGAPSVYGLAQHLSGDIPKSVLAAYRPINTFLAKFFSGKSDFRFGIQEESIVQQLLGLTPTFVNDSILTAVRKSGFRYCLLNKLQWRIQFTYLVMMICLEEATGSTCIAAIIIYLIDVAIVKWSSNLGRANLGRKSLLDDRLFL
jgi:meckelin